MSLGYSIILSAFSISHLSSTGCDSNVCGISDEKSLIAFENNLKEIQRYQKLDRAKNEHIISLHDNTYNKVATEYKKSKQR